MNPLFQAFILLVSKGIRQLVWTRPSTSTTSSAEALSQKTHSQSHKERADFAFRVSVSTYKWCKHCSLTWLASYWSLLKLGCGCLRAGYTSLVLGKAQEASFRQRQAPDATNISSNSTRISHFPCFHYHLLCATMFSRYLFLARDYLMDTYCMSVYIYYIY